MRIAVCVKQIPGPDVPARLDPERMTLDRSRGLILDDADSYGVEVALQIVQAQDGGELTAISMAPEGETAGLRTALAMGAGSAVVVSDPALAASDALSTAKVLAAVIRQVRDIDLVLCASESSDGYTGTVAVQLAELLGYPSVSFAKHIRLDEGVLLVDRQTEDGHETVRCPLPAVVTVTAGIVEPRYPTLKGVVGARSKPIRRLSLADLGIAPEHVGVLGSRQQVTHLEQSEGRLAGDVIVDDGTAEEAIIERLVQWDVL